MRKCPLCIIIRHHYIIMWPESLVPLFIQFDNITAEVTQNTEALQAGKSELNELRRQKQSLEIDLQALHNMVRYTNYTNYLLDKSFCILNRQHSHPSHMCIALMIMRLHKMFSACLCACLSSAFEHYYCAARCFFKTMGKQMLSSYGGLSRCFCQDNILDLVEAQSCTKIITELFDLAQKYEQKNNNNNNTSHK